MQAIANVWTLIVAVTLLVYAVSSIWFLVLAFKRNLWWGLGVLLVPLAWVAYAVTDWDRARRPFFLGLGAGAAIFIELLLTSAFQAVFGP